MYHFTEFIGKIFLSLFQVLRSHIIYPVDIQLIRLYAYILNNENKMKPMFK
jgi:hypothetical protein